MSELKRYLVIGASSDMGIAFLKMLDDRETEDIEVIAHYGMHNEPLLELESNLKRIALIQLKADLTKEKQVDELIRQTLEHGNLDCIVYLAANKLEYMKIKKLDWDKIQQDIDIQVRGLAKIAKIFLPLMAAKRYGKVVVMISECTLGMPPKFMTNYVVTKYALLGLMKSMAIEYADKGVNVNGISPSMVETKFLTNIDSRIIEMNATDSAKKRNVKLEEVAESILFLTSKASDYMNGVNLNLTGGNK